MSRRPRFLLSLCGVAALATACSTSKASGNEVRIAAASDLILAFDEVGKAFQAETGIHPVITPGSTGLLAKQLENGAPFDLFAAADIAFAERAAAGGTCDPASVQRYALGRIVLWTRGDAPPPALADLADPRFVKIAIANPEHAPYGRAAKAALTRLGLWDTVASRMVYAENVRQSLQWAESGDADAALVALSLAIATPGGRYTVIDDALHPPIDQGLVVCGTGPGAAAARRFAAFVASPPGRAIMNRFGFLLPGEAAPRTW